MFLIFHSSCGIPGPQFVERQRSVEQNGSEIALIEHVLKLNEAVLEKEEGISCEVPLAFTHLETLQNWADLFGQIFKLTNVGVSRPPNDFYVSCFCNIINDIVKHITAQLSAPVHFERQNENSH